MTQTQIKLKTIKEHYDKALLLIRYGKEKEATKLIYEDMGRPLYDYGLDIVYSNIYNIKVDLKTKKQMLQLKKLITKVDNKLTGESEQSDTEEILVNSDDEKWYNDIDSE